MKNIGFLIFIGISCFALSVGCKKEFLNAKPNTDIVQPITIEELASMLSNAEVMNSTGCLGILASDEYRFRSDAIWSSARTATERNSYIWTVDLYEGELSPHWDIPYSAIFYANYVLKSLLKIEEKSTSGKEWRNLKGWALFVRAFAYYELVNNFAATYDSSTSSIDLGVPLRFDPSIDELMPRSNVSQTYTRILFDLTEAASLLNRDLPIGRNAPSKVAAHALFSRIYLTMRNYQKAELHADSCLLVNNKLIDYNTLNKTSLSPFPLNHDEQIYAKSATNVVTYSTVNNTTIQIAQDLIDLYEAYDLRLSIFFSKQLDGTYNMKRGYNGSSGIYPFVGLATDEVYLIKAECLARRNEAGLAMDMLNHLKVKRWNPNAISPAKPYQDMTAVDGADALAQVLLERRKELVWRGLRWDDLKRLNKEGANITLTRKINGETYTLPPNSPRYVFPIPDNEINLSRIKQNER